MDNISVISLSSSSSRASPTEEARISPVSVTSINSETHRVRVTLHQEESDTSLQSPQNSSQRVNDWICSCKCGDQNGHSPIEIYDSDDNNSPETGVCIRYDFNKESRSATSPGTCYTRTKPLYSYMEESRKNFLARNNNSQSNTVNGNVMSPISHKKEFCNYLQLMKPTDKLDCSDNNKTPQNRRSNRVKNLEHDKSRIEECFKNRNQFEDFQEFEKVVEDVINCPTLKSLQELNMKIDRFEDFFNNFKKQNGDKMGVNKYMPLPSKDFTEKSEDFEDSMREIIEEVNRERVKEQLTKCLKKINTSPAKNKFKMDEMRLRRGKFNFKVSPFGKGIPIETVLKRKRGRPRKTLSPEDSNKAESSRCEIVAVPINSDDENVDLINFVDDMLELDKMSEAHRKSVIESRILSSNSITSLIQKKISQDKSQEVQEAYRIFSEITQESQTKDAPDETEENRVNFAATVVNTEHDYAADGDCISDESASDFNDEVETLSPDIEVNPVNNNVPKKSLQGSLTVAQKRKFFAKLKDYATNSKNSKHSINICEKDGVVLRAFYQDYNLVVTQENCVSFWTQSALGNILGAQDMWIPKGSCQRLSYNTYFEKSSHEMLSTSYVSIAYVELWSKEHKSDVRQMPVADVFATVYFWRLRQEGIDKKALQLQNIKGFTDDVQYVVLRSSPKIIVSWRSIQGDDRKTKVHAYHLAPDFQIVAAISELQTVEHYVASLHNVEDGDNLILGCGEDKITLWNVDHGYIVATLQLNGIKATLNTLWVKCDRGFLFTIQECEDHELRLIAINGMNKSWKKLQTYQPLTGFDSVRGVYIENGILVAYYLQGIACWNAQNGELIVEELLDDEYKFLPSGKHVIMIANEQIIVRHSLSHFITADDL